jgi:fused signal recognition particle receptor
VLDATVGQNALSQAELFHQCCELTGIALTKMDGTAKGGAVFMAVDKLKLPILYVGVGETLDDLLDFSADDFVGGLLPEA